jgi:hypothetical protein
MKTQRALLSVTAALVAATLPTGKKTGNFSILGHFPAR